MSAPTKNEIYLVYSNILNIIDSRDKAYKILQDLAMSSYNTGHIDGEEYGYRIGYKKEK